MRLIWRQIYDVNGTPCFYQVACPLLDEMFRVHPGHERDFIEAMSQRAQQALREARPASRRLQ